MQAKVRLPHGSTYILTQTTLTILGCLQNMTQSQSINVEPLSTSLTVITLINISAQITEFYLIKKYNYFIKKFTLSLWSILHKSIWYNYWIQSGKNYLINNTLEYNCISKIKYILDEKCNFIDHSKINLKYKVNISLLELLKYHFLHTKIMEKNPKHLSTPTSIYSHRKLYPGSKYNQELK